MGECPGCLLAHYLVVGSGVFTCVPAYFDMTQHSWVEMPLGHRQVCRVSASVPLPSEGLWCTRWAWALPCTPFCLMQEGMWSSPFHPVRDLTPEQLSDGAEVLLGEASLCPQERASALLPLGELSLGVWQGLITGGPTGSQRRRAAFSCLSCPPITWKPAESTDCLATPKSF